jgi:hypothetical protein
VLGAEHPATLTSANNLAWSLSGQGKHLEAEQMLLAAFASLQRVLGPTHPHTLTMASRLEHMRARIRATPPNNTAAPAAAGAARPLPAGTRVLVQRLVAKPEHNGKRGCAVVRRAHRPVCRFAGRREAAVAQGRVRGEGRRVRGGGDARRRRRAACALDARRCGTARASASARTVRRTSRRASAP